MGGIWLRLARSPAGHLITGLLFTHFSFLLPVKRLRETETLVAFHHPRPVYPVHILLVPKRPLDSLVALSTADTDFMQDLFRVVKGLVQELELDPAGYRLIANGGAYQDVPHLHFHLVSGSESGEEKGLEQVQSA